MSKINLLHLISHPIQYQVPLYERIAADADIDFKVLYCSKQGIETQFDKEFGTTVKWDIPLLRGYQHTFLKNYARHESLDNFSGLTNWGIIKELSAAPRNSILWIHGWNYVTLILGLVVGKVFGHRIFLRGENTAVIENNKPNSFAKQLKTFWFSRVLFKFTNTFLAVGNQNKAYFKQMSVPENKISFAPYCIDNERFTQFFQDNKNNIAAIRQSLGIPLSKKVVIFSGKYIEKKRPLDLLKAMAQLPNQDNVFAVFVGEGHLRGEMEQFIKDNNLQKNVLLTGFINQSLMPHYYIAADLYVMCSGMYETWGLSTNEALCFGLPIVLSDMVGSAYDLIDGNGFMYPCGNVDALAQHIETVFSLPENELQTMRERSLAIVKNYSYDKIIAAIKTAGNR